MTDAEQLLWKCLRGKQLGGFKFRRQHPVERYVLDFYCPAVKLAVELDGGQHNTESERARDEERSAWLGQQGIRVVRFWNHEVLSNLEGVLQRIWECVHSVTPPPQPSPAGGGSGGGDDGKRLYEGGTGPAAYADAITTYLGLALNKVADRGSTICGWDSGFQKIANTFGRQAIPMKWDFAEANPFSGSTGGVDGALDFTAKAVIGFSPSIFGDVQQRDATTQSSSEDKVISSDPPYYDNIGYADLSDFFYVWLRRSLRAIFPDLFSTLAVPKAEELVATPYRHGSKEEAEVFFLTGMTRAMERLAQQAHPAFPVTIFYAFKQAESDGGDGTASTGWETFLAAVIRAGFSITGTWPMRTEYTGNLKRNVSALASSIVLVCRKRAADAPVTTRREFLTALKAELPAALGPGMAVFTRCAKVFDAEGRPLSVREALALINQSLD